MRTIKSTLSIVAFAIAIFALVKCVPSAELTSAITPTFKTFDVPTSEFTVNANEGGKIEMENGTIINIPPKCFIDFDGNILEGDVVLKYREFHNPEDVIASGIPMKFKENGNDGYLATAGMIQLNGTNENGDEIKIAEGKNIDFELASYIETDNVDFFDLNEETGEWTKTGTPGQNALVSANAIQDSIERMQKVMAPFKPKKFNENTPVVRFQTESENDLLKGMSSVVWQYAGTDETYNPFTIDAFKNDKYEIKSTKIIDKKLKTLEVEIDFKGKNNDTIGSPKSMITWFSPVFTNKDFDEAIEIFEDKEAMYNKLMDKKKKYQEMLNSSAKVSRSFSISGFGYYNCDVFTREPFTSNEYIFTLNGQKYEEPASLYLIHRTGKLKTVVNLGVNYGSTSELKLMQRGENSLVAVLPNDEVKVFDEKAVRDFDINNTNLLELSIDDKVAVSSVKNLGSLLQ